MPLGLVILRRTSKAKKGKISNGANTKFTKDGSYLNFLKEDYYV